MLRPVGTPPDPANAPARIEAIEPGVTLEEFTASGDVQQALNFWDDVEGGLRETVFFVGAAEGNAVAA